VKVVGLGGGIGASRLWKALLAYDTGVDLTLAVNTGDDIWIHGLRVCPDLDTVLYALSGRQDTGRGWGVRGETWECMRALTELDAGQWFNLGDRDLAVHLFRTGRLRAGQRLSTVAGDLAQAFGIPCRVLPVTDAEVTTRVVTGDGRDLHYQEFLVRERADVDVLSTYVEGVSAADPAPGLLAHLVAADLVVIGPSNPVASLGPVLGLRGMRETLSAIRAKTVVVTPTVESVPITDRGEHGRARSRALLLRAAGFDATPAGVAAFYADLASAFVLDRADAGHRSAIEELDMRVVMADTLVHQGADPGHLVRALLQAGLTAELGG